MIGELWSLKKVRNSAEEEKGLENHPQRVRELGERRGRFSRKVGEGKERRNRKENSKRSSGSLRE